MHMPIRYYIRQKRSITCLFTKLIFSMEEKCRVILCHINCYI